MPEPLQTPFDAVLLPNGDIWARDDTGYNLGKLLHAEEMTGPNTPLRAEIAVADLKDPTIPFRDELGWPVRIVSGQGKEPIQGRTAGISLRVVLP